MVIGDQAEGGKGTVNKQVFCLLAGHPGRTLAQKVVQTGKEKLVDGRSRRHTCCAGHKVEEHRGGITALRGRPRRVRSITKMRGYDLDATLRQFLGRKIPVIRST